MAFVAFVILLFSSCAAQAQFGYPNRDSWERITEPIVIGVQRAAEAKEYQDAVDKTIAILINRYGNDNIVIRRVSDDVLLSLIQARRLDFVISDSNFYSCHDVSENLAPIASMWPYGSPSPDEVVGSAFVTKASNTDINNIAQMQKKVAAALSETSFTGWYVALREIRSRGFVPEKFFERVNFYGNDPESVFNALDLGLAEVGIVPACTLERLVSEHRIDPFRYKAVGAKSHPYISCLSSTKRYPGLYFYALPSTNPQFIKIVSELILTSNILGGSMQWSAPVSSRSVHDLMFDLRIGPYAHLSRWQFETFVRDHSGAFVATLCVILLVVAYSAIVSFVVRSRTAQLHQALEDREEMEKIAELSRERITGLERASVVGMMSSMIAHELKQPLGAINNFANGMLRRVQRGNVDKDLLVQILGEIVEQNTRASEIVNRVRSYAKRKTPELQRADLKIPIQRAVDTYTRSRRSDARIIMMVSGDIFAKIDAWEIEIAVYNLLKNAADSVSRVSGGEIVVRVVSSDDYWLVEVRDNGPKITQEDVDKFMLALVSTKESGLGIGLSIVATIAERNNSHLHGYANEVAGVTMSLKIPKDLPEDAAGAKLSNVNI